MIIIANSFIIFLIFVLKDIRKLYSQSSDEEIHGNT